MSKLSKALNLNYPEYYEFPESIISREGVEININSDSWVLPIIEKRNKLDFLKIPAINYRAALKKYVIHRIETVSSISGYLAYCRVWQKIFKNFIIIEDSIKKSESRLITAIETTIGNLKDEQKLYEIYEVVQWYIWCSEVTPELGFNQEYAVLLDCMIIPGGPKGEAVRAGDPDTGPLNYSLELSQVIKALKADKSLEYDHIQQKAAVALSIAFGRNPKNITYLQEQDFENLTPDSETPCFVIHIPRIKKRQLDPRDDLVTEYLEPELAVYIQDLINANKSISTLLNIDGKNIEVLPKPLFIAKKINQIALETKQYKYGFNMYSLSILNLIKNFIKRHQIYTPISDGLLNVTLRRLRYSLGTNLAGQGISRKELAKALDHTDTQHVDVYFDMKEKIVDHLDKAVAKSFARKLNILQGNIITDKSEAVNGSRDDKRLYFTNENNPSDEVEIGVCGSNPICNLDPPYSCYLCPKFQPYQHADHEHVLDLLIKSKNDRNKKYEQARLGVQLDDVILAVSQAIVACKNLGESNE